MKCRYCSREAVYDDGLCESCHRAAMDAEAKVMSEQERDSFRGQTIEEDGTVRDEQAAYEARRVESRQHHSSGIHIMTGRLPWRVKLAIGVIVFCVLAVIVSALGFLIMALPYLLGAFVIYFVYNCIKSFLNR